ncbi:MAG: SDR family oxidoreductase, partial [Ignavibacteria bacterium]|nr:SDR family oxidoreductase [Ignavibacteria bacterium]MCC7159293.1 SDR family oxidoreductase [Ignavibacteria bacterium]
MKDKILVIGGAGYLGAVLVENLLRRGYSVRILDSFIYGKKAVEKYTGDKRVEVINGDIRNIETVNNSMEGIGSVALLAAVVGDPASKARPEQTVETNYLAAQVVASSAKRSGVKKFIYASTCSVYGVGSEMLDEQAPLNPVSLYAKTKISSEESIMSIAGGDFSPVIMRMSTLYGFSPRMRFDLVVNTMTMTAFTGGRITVFGGNQWRPLLSLEDAADAYIKVLESKMQMNGGKIYNVGSEEQNYIITDVAKLVAEGIKKASGKDIPINIEGDSTDARDYRVTFKKIQAELGFTVRSTIPNSAAEIWSKLESREIDDPKRKIYYNHYFDASEELIG